MFVGRDEGGFVENYAYDIGEGGENSGKIYINIEVQNNPVDAELIGETIFDSMRKAFFADLEKDPYVRFEDAVRSTNKALQKIKEEKASDYIGTLHVVIAAIVGNTLYLTQTGEAEAYLIRRRLCSTVSEGLGEDSVEEMFTNIASGSLEPGDFVLFSSTRLLRFISKTDLAKILSGRNLISTLGELKDYLMTEVLGRIGLTGIAVSEGAPALTQKEHGQIKEHLEKEEFYDKKRPGKSGYALKDTLNTLTAAVNDLRQRVTALADKGKARVSRSGSVRREGGGLNLKAMGKDRMLVTLIAAIIILTLSIWWIKGQATEQAKIEGYSVTLNEVQETLNSAETTGQYNKDQAGQMLSQAKQKALEVLNSGYHRSKANELLGKIQESQDALDGVMHPDVRTLADLSEKRDNVSALGLLHLGGTLYAYEYNALYPIVLDKVQDPLTIDENETVIAGAVYDDKDSLLFYTKSGKVMEFKDNRVSFVDTADGAFKKGVAIEAYSNKIYILDSAGNQIWRYTRRRDSFDAAEAYNINADLAKGIDLAIDGNIYVLGNDGYITKLFSGNKEEFPIKKEPIDPLENPTRIYTELDMGSIYILEPDKQRVLVYYKDDKTGGASYDRQLVFDDMTDLRDLFVDKDTNKLYLLDQSKIYEVAL
ncbi:hypothetical protein KJ951_02185 [Patescibacteria group bacterium]|nr:hypothetical protein [Patescibacteria group bacterium]MBU1703189.1 hypothetical protein [Patescibacteria group bacterium]MBU1953527.1 hypothetical protein [Patescibacteria group bacterium]